MREILEMERFSGKAEEEDQGALALEWVSLPVVGLGNALQLPKEDLAGAVRVL